MRKTLLAKSLFALSAIGVIALAAPASAQDYYDYPTGYRAAPWVAGAAAGTAAGLALSQGWWTGSTVGTTLGASAAGSAVAGGVIGIGTVAMIDAATQPCAGFRAIMSPFLHAPGQSGCVNGQYVGYRVAERPLPRRHYR
jgi:hypothetical protein